MYTIILLLILIHQCHSDCFEQYKFTIPEEYHNDTNPNAPTFRVRIKKDGQSIGTYHPHTSYHEIYYYRIILKISTRPRKYVNIYFKPSKHDPRGHYEIILLFGTRHELLTELNITNWSSQRKQNQTHTTITKNNNKYTCNTHNRWARVLWYIFRDNQTHIMDTTGNIHIYTHQLKNFTKLYCTVLFRCQISDILYSNGTTEVLTWETDFRPDPAIVKPTQKNSNSRGGGGHSY